MKTDRIWRALSIALALCLTLALAPTCAFAADADTEPAEDGVSTSGVTDVTGGRGGVQDEDDHHLYRLQADLHRDGV